MKRLAPWFLLAGFALVIFGAKLRFIESAGSDLPMMDAWDAESENVFRPWLEGRLTSADIFRPHNEHRVVTTKLFALGLFAANGQWDVRLETTANAAIHTLAALTLLWLSRRWLRGVWLVLLGGFLILLFTLPFSWENTLNGFQVQFYFLLLFSLLHLWLVLAAERFTWRWCAGQLCGALAVLSMASGFFSSAVIVVVVGTRLLATRRIQSLPLATASIGLLYSIIGWFLKNPVPGHEPLHAHTPADFIHSLLQLLGWPGPWFLPWVFAPALLFLFHRTTRRDLATADSVLLGLLGWSVLQCAALAYGRGGGGSVLSSRYLDLLSVNLALGFIFVATELSGRPRRLLAGAWLVGTVAVLIYPRPDHWRGEIVPDGPQQARQQDGLRNYLRTLDPGDLLNRTWPDIPYPDAAALLQRLQPRVICAIMPPSVRRSLPLGDDRRPAPTAVPSPLPPSKSPVAFSTFDLSPPKKFSWLSARQTAGALPILRFSLAGDLGAPGRQLHLFIRSNDQTTEILPDGPPGLRWKTLNVSRPAGTWWIEATDEDASAWFALTEPVEVGRGTWFAEKLLKQHILFLLGGIVLLGLGGGLTVFRRDAASTRT